MSVDANLDAFKSMAVRLQTLGSETLKSAMKECAETALDFVAESFEKGTDPYGAKWPQSARARKQSGQTLVDDGILRNSFTDKISADSFTVTSNVKYAAIHQFGGEIQQKPRLQTLRFNKKGRFVKKTAKRIARTVTTTIGDRTITMPQRMMVPTGDSLPQKWTDAFQSIINKHAILRLKVF